MSSIGIEPHVITISTALIGNITIGGIVLWGIRISLETGESNRCPQQAVCVTYYITFIIIECLYYQHILSGCIIRMYYRHSTI